ncbi:gliding motility-associated C-terminal domain-containing protein [Ancylomarina sp. 16SWW S1-10-2]|uniref:T9SS type B sorting domain-containing protein n=1 Tax=Ancylomarina sp. 16SWW S1-10-2 TaxID=2499681 RepID=UPI0012AE440F|nr:gliding motility-associated C-terminal domain-containing protein [Ancylomarina sp. 16SWW S1-10-2]MRT91821.1 T9SS type B sorting domain-containing protein [Ancylomarina sp. 16SWW S1-10-2]
MNTKAISLLYIIVLLSFSNTLSAKDFYWIGGSGNWNEISHWSDQPGGQVNPGAVVPNSNDNVFFDENSFPTTGAVLVINDVANCANMDWTGVTNFPKLEADTEPAHFLTISGRLKLVTNMYFDLLKPLYFSSTKLGNEIDFAGHIYNEDIHFSKNGGWIIKTELVVANHKNIYFEQGNLSFEADVTCDQIISDNSNSRTWNLNNSTIALTGSETSVLNINTNNLTLNAGESSIITTKKEASIQTSGNTSISLYNVEFQNSGTIITNSSLNLSFNDVEFKAGGSLQGPNTFHNLIFTQGNSYQIYGGSIQTINGQLTAIGTCSQHIYISGFGGSGTLNASTTSLEYLKVNNITATGAATFDAPNSFDLGVNSGWNFTAPAPQSYSWTGVTDNKWSTPTNWSPNCVPSRIDVASINGVSVVIDVDAECKDLVLTGVVNLSGSSNLSIYGLLNAGSTNWDLTGTTHFEGDGTHSISIDDSFKGDVYFSGNGIWNLGTELKISDNTLYFESGTLNSNSNNIELNQFVSTGDNTRTLNLGTSTVKLNGNILKTWDVEGNAFNISETDYTIELIKPKAGFYNKLGGSVTYKTVHFTDTSETKANLTNEGAQINFEELKFFAGANISGDHNFETFILSAGNTYLFEPGSKQNITKENGFIAEGTCSDFIYLEGNGDISTIKTDVNSNRIKYVQITDLEVIGGVTSTGGLDAQSSFGIKNYDGWHIIEKTTAENFKWTGASDSDWFNSNNWDLGCVPTRIDDVIFDAGNLTGNKIKTIAINGTREPVCYNMTWSNASTLTFKGSNDLYIYGSLDFSTLPAGSFTHTGDIYFKSKDVVNIKLDQVKLGQNAIFEGQIKEDETWDAGTWNLDSDFEATGNIELVRGTLISNNYTITCDELNSNYSDDRSLVLGSSIINLNGIFLTPENLSLNAGTSNIIIAKDGEIKVTSGADPVTFYNITFEEEVGTALFSIYGKSVSFNQIDVKSNANFNYEGFDVEKLILNQGKTYKFLENKIYNIGDITANGACEGTIDISSLESGSKTTFNSKDGKAISVSQVNLLDVFATPAGTFTANNSIDLGNNTGWNFATTPTPRNLYWVNGTGNWDDPNHWATSTGGTAGACVPTALDNVYFDINSFTGSKQIVSIGSGDIRCRTMDWTGSEDAKPIFEMGDIEISSVYIYGSLILNANLTIDFLDVPVDFYFRSTETGQTLALYGFDFPNNVSFDGIGGEWTLTDNLSVDGSLIIDNGSFISGGHDIICEYFESKDLTLAGKIRTIDIQNSTLTVLGYDGSYSVKIDVAGLSNSKTLSLFTNESELIIESEKTFFIGGQNTSSANFNIIKFNNTNSLSSDNLLTQITDLTFEEGGGLEGNLNIEKLTLNEGTKPNTFEFESGVTFPIDTLVALGTCNFPLDIKGSKNGNEAKLDVTGTVTADFIELTDINGIDSGVSYIATNSIKHDNVTNWNVSSITAVDLYWVGNGLNDDWSNYLNWSKTSGGTSEGCIPTEQDNVFFDSNSFLGSKTVLVDIDASCHNMTWEDDVDPASIFKVPSQLNVHGFLNFSEKMTLEMSGNLKFNGDGLTPEKSINFAGKTLNGNIYFNGKNQSWILSNSLLTTGDLFLVEGSLNSKGFDINISSFTSINGSSSANRNLDISSSNVTINATDEDYKSWHMDMTGSPMTFAAVNSELYFSNKGGIYCKSDNDVAFGDAVFDGYGQIDLNGDGTESGKGTFKTVIFRQEGHILGDHTIYNLEFTLGYGNNTIQGGRTINLTNDLIMEGVNCSPIYLKSDTPGVNAMINSTKQQIIYNATLDHIEMTDGKMHRVIGVFLDVDDSCINWIDDSETDDDSEIPPSFKETLDPHQEWCRSTATIENVTTFPINGNTTFQWAFSEPAPVPPPPSSYTDLTDETSAIITVSKSGYYKVEINYNPPDGSICKLYSTIEVVMNATSNMKIEFTSTNVQCYSENVDDADGYIKAVVSDGNSGYTFFWTDEKGDDVTFSTLVGSDESSASGLAPGKYFVKVSDAEGCEQTSSTDIFDAYEMFINDITQKDLKCFNVSDGEIHIDATGGTGDLTYYLDGSLQSSSDITGLSADEYLVHVQDGHNCKSDEESVILLSPEEITFDPLVSNISCYGDKNGSINPQVEGGIAPFNYSWTATNGFTSTLGEITGLDGGMYTIDITDGNNCLYTENIEITEPEAISINELSISPANCFGESTGELFIEANKGTPPYEYTIDEKINTNGQFTGLSANTYSLQITDKNACVKLQDVTIDEPEVLGFVVSDSLSPSCEDLEDGIINIVPYGGNNGYTFSWSGPNDFRSYSQNNTDLDFGEYILLLKDNKECTYKDTVELAKSQPLQLGLVVEEEVSARGAKDGIFKLEILGGTPSYAYTVSGPNGYVEASPTFFDDAEATFENLAGGLYTVTITDAGSCGAIAKDIMLPEGDLLIAQIINEENISCTGYSDGTLDAIAIGGNDIYSYSWAGPSGFTANTQSISGLAAGTYTLTVQSAGQTATDQGIIIEPTPLVAIATPTNVSCFNEPNGSIELDISGGTKPYSVLWEGDRGLFSLADKIYDLAEGTYNYQVTDDGGCPVSGSVTITQPNAVKIIADPTDISDMGLRDGALTATATEGTSPWTIFISGPNKYSNKLFDDPTGISKVDKLEQGVYIVEVLDANGCRDITETRIYEKEKMVVSLVSKTSPTCHGSNEGSIEVLIEDGSGDYTLSWEADNYYQNLDAPLKIENLKAGNYTLTVTDNVADAFSGEKEVIIFKQEIKEPDPVEIEVSMDQISCYGLTDGHINIYPKGGTPNYTYVWEGNIDPAEINNEDQGNLEPGEYKVTVTDSRGCLSEEYPFEIIEPELFDGKTTPKQPLCYGDKNGEIKLDITTGKFPYIINWNNGAVTNTIYNLKKGTYSYTVTDRNNCELTGSAILTQPDTLIAEINDFTDVICYGQNNGEASATVTGGTVPYRYEWWHGASTQEISNLRPKEYYLKVIDKNGCQDTTSVVIKEPEELLVRAEANRPTIEGSIDGAIFAKGIGGIPEYTASWEIETGANMWEPFETGLELNDLDRGKYRLTLTDQNFCTRDTLINLEYLYDRIIEIPKAYTPNGDGYNDTWDILRIEYIQRLTIIVYDRLGAVVYKFTGTGNEYKGNQWTGIDNNSNLPIGTYYYAIEADDSKPLTGSVTIAR